MSKTAIGIIVAIVVVGAAAGIAIFAMQKPAQTPQHTDAPGTTHQEESTKSNNQTEQPASENAVTIENSAFSPATITVKKGTTVTWTNQDNVGHNVISKEGGGGLPTEHALLQKGETFSHTFNEIGSFDYICQPHPFMKGTVEVTE